jgi:hypothetical protein
MPNDYLRLNDDNINIEKAQNLIAIIEDKRKDPVYRKDLQNESSLFAELFKAFKDFFSNLGKPTIQKRYQKIGSPARSEDYNQTSLELFNDINLAYKEANSLSTVMVKNFNYSEAERQMLRNKVKQLNSDSIDYFLATPSSKTQTLFGTDTFNNNSKIDTAKLTSGYSAAQLIAGQGIITLKRKGNIDRSSTVLTVTGLQESVTAWNPSTSTGAYEGLFWAKKTAMRPEGTGLHLEYASNGNTLFELGAPEEEKVKTRMKMFDSNPDTFWEIEYVTDLIVGYRDTTSGKQISVAEFNALFNNTVSSPNVQLAGNTVVTGQYGSLIENYVPVTQTAIVSYLNVNFTVNLTRTELLNWISLNPNNFGEKDYIQILSIETSEDGSTFTKLEGFDDNEYNITITGTANRELNSDLVNETLSPDKFKYAGQGIWLFAPRKVSSLRFTIRQPQSYIQPYDVLMVQTSQTVTTTTTTTSWFGLFSDTSTSSQTYTNNIQVPYLLGQVCGFDVHSLDGGGQISAQGGPDIAAIVGGAVGGAIAGGLIEGALAGAVFGPVGAVIGGILGLVFGSLFGSSESSSSVGPQTISNQWTQTLYDKARFAIGVRDIELYSYTFDTQSEVISMPYTSPKPISKVSLTVDETIPKEFYANSVDASNDWIKYYISVNDGVSWSRISPSTHRDTLSEDGINMVPQIININSDIIPANRKNPLAYIDTASTVYDIRFRAVLLRPTDITDSESFTPYLSSYSLQLYPLGGL